MTDIREPIHEGNVAIYIATHKAFIPPKNRIYVPIQVGKALSDIELGYRGDNIGNNISALNPYYCELTGLYWIWKNDTHPYVGLVHYRRYFYNRQWKILNISDVKEILPTGGVIVAQRGYNLETVLRRYEKHHMPEDLEYTRDVIRERHPAYLESYDKVLSGYYYCPYNMLLTSRPILESYCNWLFDILENVRAEIGNELIHRAPYDARALGFLGERLLNVWLRAHQEVPSVEVPVLNTTANLSVQKAAARIKGWIS